MDLQTPLSQSKNRAVKMYASRLEKLGIFTYQDFLFHLPSRYEDYSLVSKINQVQIGETVTVKGQVLEMKNQYLRGGRIKTMQKATIADETGSMQLTWFNQPFLVNAIHINSTIAASGKVDYFAKAKTISNPEFELLSDENASSIHTGRLIPIYPETKGVSSKWLRRQVYSLIQLEKLDLEEYLPEKLITQYNFMDIEAAIKEAHFPKNLDTAMQAIERLAFDELFIMQLAAKKRRETWVNLQKATPLEIKKYRTQIDTFIKSLPFKLTSAQHTAVDDILRDIGQEKAMNRLLQGDVGSGKTVVGAVAMYAAFLCGKQSVLMAPTEILAVQHFKTIHSFLEPFGVKVDILTGNKKSYSSSEAKRSREVNAANSSRQARTINTNFDILVGTHAVLSEKIKFDNLSLVIIDEQQRFGVEQRGVIRQKGQNTHLLTMTATPIPRTVALTMYGDLDVSYLNEMPIG
jgi:ATP-dependent DNA helicase RecG